MGLVLELVVSLVVWVPYLVVLASLWLMAEPLQVAALLVGLRVLWWLWFQQPSRW
jgi:uncharacterized membrane protein (GlpM family)